MYVGESSYVAKTSDCTRPGQNIWVLPRYYSKNVYCCICFIYLCLCLACPKGRIIWKIISSYHKHKNNQKYIYKITNHIHTKILKGYPFLTPFMMFDVRKLWVSSFMLVILQIFMTKRNSKNSITQLSFLTLTFVNQS